MLSPPRILGIDPGLGITGYGCVSGTPSSPALIEAGVFRLTRSASIPTRLAELDRDFRALLERLKPEVIAVESLFAHYKHPATAIAMGHARGILLLAAHTSGARLMEFRPNMVKKALTGHGHATKAQMQAAIKGTFGLAKAPEPADMADALAVALCAFHRLSLGLGESPSRRRTRRTLPDGVIAD